MEQKIIITYEVGNDAIQAAAFMVGVELTDELLSKMRQEPLVITEDMVSVENGMQCKLAFALLAIEIAAKKAGNDLQDN